MKPRILLVEDDEFVSAVVCGVLSHAGFEVLVADRFEKVRMLEPFEFAAVMTDFQLPGGNGCEVIEYARSRSPHIAALLVSGDGDSMMSVAADRGLTNVCFLNKPFRPNQLVEKMNEVLATNPTNEWRSERGAETACS